MSSLIHNPVTQYKLYIYVDDVDLKKKYEEQIENRIENNTTDSGFDLFTANEEVYKPGQLKMINHKVKCKMVVQSNFGPEIPTGFLLHPRSSTFKKYQLLMSNNTGIIDQDYRGDIIAAMYCPITESDFKFLETSALNLSPFFA